MTEQLSIGYRRIAELEPHSGNPRTHSKKQIRQIARSVEQFGFTNPILLDQEERVLAGHGRLAAARLLGMAQVPTIRLAEMSEVQKRAYALADNRLAEAAGWDRELLTLELRYKGELGAMVKLLELVLRQEAAAGSGCEPEAPLSAEEWQVLADLEARLLRQPADSLPDDEPAASGNDTETPP